MSSWNRTSRIRAPSLPSLRLDEASWVLLDQDALRFGTALRRLNALLEKGFRLEKANKQFVQEGITARPFNGMAATLRGIRASRRECCERELRSKRRRVRSQRSQPMAVIDAVMVSMLLLRLLQALLLRVALEDFLSGRRSLLWAVAGGSAASFGAACWLIRYLSPRRIF